MGFCGKSDLQTEHLSAVDLIYGNGPDEARPYSSAHQRNKLCVPLQEKLGTIGIRHLAEIQKTHIPNY